MTCVRLSGHSYFGRDYGQGASRIAKCECGWRSEPILLYDYKQTEERAAHRNHKLELQRQQEKEA